MNLIRTPVLTCDHSQLLLKYQTITDNLQLQTESLVGLGFGQKQG